MIPVYLVRKWLQESADILRDGGAPETAAVYEEVIELFDIANGPIRLAMREKVNEAERRVISSHGNALIFWLRECGCVAVPKEWVE